MDNETTAPATPIDTITAYENSVAEAKRNRKALEDEYASCIKRAKEIKDRLRNKPKTVKAAKVAKPAVVKTAAAK